GRQPGEDGQCSREPRRPAQARTQHPSIPSRSRIHTSKNQACRLGRQLPSRHTWSYAIALASPGRPACPSRASGWSSLTTSWGLPCCVRFPCVHAVANTPAQRLGAPLRSIRPNRVSLPRYGSRVGLCIVLFEACSAFTRVTACTLALSPYIVTRYPKASATSSPP